MGKIINFFDIEDGDEPGYRAPRQPVKAQLERPSFLKTFKEMGIAEGAYTPEQMAEIETEDMQVEEPERPMAPEPEGLRTIQEMIDAANAPSPYDALFDKED